MPARGPLGGGTTVTIQGTGLAEVHTITFGGMVTEFHIASDNTITAISPPRLSAGMVALTVAGSDGAMSAWFTYDEYAPAAEPAPALPHNRPLVDPCSTSIAPTAPGERIVIPFPAACGLESVIVQLPQVAGKLSLHIAPLAGLPNGALHPEMVTAPTFIFEAKLLDANGSEVEPASAVVQVRVPATWLETCLPAQCRPALFHYHGDAWTREELTTVDEANGTLVLQAEVSGFSLFAVAGAGLPAAATFAFPMWGWPLAAAGVLGIPALAVVVQRRRHAHQMAEMAARADAGEAGSEKRVEMLLQEMRNKEELLQFVNNAAHDLANPLTPIQLQLDLLADAARERADPEQEESLSVVRTNVTQLESLIKDLRDAAKLQSGKLRLTPVPLDLAVLVSDAGKSYAAQAGLANVELAIDVHGPIPVRADGANVMRVLTNFLSNALKFTPPGGRVQLHASCDDREASVHVRDTGLGLTEQDRAVLFRPFSQVHGEEQKAKGTGLGLFISKGVIEGHGGKIGCTSEGQGMGSTFWFTMPLGPESEPAQPAAREPAPDAIDMIS